MSSESEWAVDQGEMVLLMMLEGLSVYIWALVVAATSLEWIFMMSLRFPGVSHLPDRVPVAVLDQHR